MSRLTPIQQPGSETSSRQGPSRIPRREKRHPEQFKGYVLDLRNNPGRPAGSGGFGWAGAFLDQRRGIVSIRGVAIPKQVHRYNAAPGDHHRGGSR